MIQPLKFLRSPAADQNRALHFYTDNLGFTIITDQPFDEKQRWIELRVPKAETRVVLFTPDGDERRIGSMMPMSFSCDDIDKTYEELKSRGVEFEGPPQKQPWGKYAMFKTARGIASSSRLVEGVQREVLRCCRRRSAKRSAETASAAKPITAPAATSRGQCAPFAIRLIPIPIAAAPATAPASG